MMHDLAFVGAVHAGDDDQQAVAERVDQQQQPPIAAAEVIARDLKSRIVDDCEGVTP